MRRLTAGWGRAQWGKDQWGHALNANTGTPVSIAFHCDQTSTVLFKTKMRMGMKFTGDMVSTALFGTETGTADVECAFNGQTYTAAGLTSSPLHDAPISN